MARPRTNRPTDAEMAILNVLWTGGDATVRQVIQRLKDDGVALASSSILKLMQIMHAKVLLQKDEAARPQIFRPTSRRDTTQRMLVRDLAKRAFDGSLASLALTAVSLRPLSSDERSKLLHAIEHPGTGDDA